MKSVDIEKLNRDNFKSIINSLSMPGSVNKIKSLYDSHLLAVANTLLYSEVSFFYDGNEDINLIKAITNAKEESVETSDYIFCDEINEYSLSKSKIGTAQDPEFSSTLIFKCKNFEGLNLRLSGPGINEYKDVSLPIDNAFVDFFNEKNSSYPLGNEVFFLNKKGEVIALSRTTKVEVI
ncbi:phosphonate C-P lyase system protein PhnH [Arcobacter sp. LA11]|uniref:phosphonate C-P lyase system protein PhnH n=1 Tax=Arcobacter sp. LA11 TaxID=1898176 RepID=UPI000934E42C|nr:phosphonate C-P lyase system protein PhnH [Arcobacter sp. LA11]